MAVGGGNSISVPPDSAHRMLGVIALASSERTTYQFGPPAFPSTTATQASPERIVRSSTSILKRRLRREANPPVVAATKPWSDAGATGTVTRMAAGTEALASVERVSHASGSDFPVHPAR